MKYVKLPLLYFQIYRRVSPTVFAILYFRRISLPKCDPDVSRVDYSFLIDPHFRVQYEAPRLCWFFLILCAFGVHLIYDHPHSYFPEVMLHIAQFHVSPSGLYMVSPFSRNVFTRSRPRWSNIILFIAILPSILYESIASHQRSCGSEIWYDFLNLRTSSNLYNRSCRRRVYAKYRQSCYIMGHMSSCLMCVIVPLLYKYVDARSTLIRSIILYGPAYSFVVAISC